MQPSKFFDAFLAFNEDDLSCIDMADIIGGSVLMISKCMLTSLLKKAICVCQKFKGVN